MNGIVIRPYAAADLDATVAIFRRAIREIAAADYGPEQVAAWSQVDRAAWAAKRASRPTWVAWRNGQAAGFSDLEPDGHLDMLYVHPAHRRRGVARRLIAVAEARALALGLEALHTEASLTARAAFEAAGFRVVAEEAVVRNGVAFRRYRMRKDELRPRRGPDR